MKPITSCLLDFVLLSRRLAWRSLLTALQIINLVFVFKTAVNRARATLLASKYSAETERVQSQVRRMVDEISGVFDSTLGDVNARFSEELEDIALSLLQHSSDAQIRVVAWSVLQQHADSSAARQHKVKLQQFQAQPANFPAAPQPPPPRALAVPSLDNDVAAAFEKATEVPDALLQELTSQQAQVAEHPLTALAAAYLVAVPPLRSKAQALAAAEAVRGKAAREAKELADKAAAEQAVIKSNGGRGNQRAANIAEQAAAAAATALRTAQEAERKAREELDAARAASDAATGTLRSEAIRLLQEDFTVLTGARRLLQSSGRAAAGAADEAEAGGPFVLDDARASVHDIARVSINADGPDYADPYEESSEELDGRSSGSGSLAIANPRISGSFGGGVVGNNYNNVNNKRNGRGAPLLGQSKARRLSLSDLLSGVSARANAKLNAYRFILDDGRNPVNAINRIRAATMLGSGAAASDDNGLGRPEEREKVHTAKAEQVQEVLDHIRIWEGWEDLANAAAQPWLAGNGMQDFADVTSLINGIGRITATAFMLLSSIIHWTNARSAASKERLDGARSVGIAHERAAADHRLAMFSESSRCRHAGMWAVPKAAAAAAAGCRMLKWSICATGMPVC